MLSTSTCLRSQRWKASICPFVDFVVIHSSELLRKMGATQAFKILSFFFSDSSFFQVCSVVFIASSVRIFLRLMSCSVSKSDPKYLHVFQSGVPFLVT